jgi:hypothetical protein
MKVSMNKFKSLLPTALLDKLAMEYSVNACNQVKLTGQTVFLCLLNGLLNHPELSQRMLEEQYKKLTGKACDHSAFGKRFSAINTEYFRSILHHLQFKMDALITKGDIGALKLRIVDATIVTLSAKLLKFGIKANHGNKGAKRQIKAVIELSDKGLPDLLHICKNQSEFSDVIALGDTMKSFTKPNDLWIFDKGCHGRHALFYLHNAGSFWITPHSTQSLTTIKVLYDGNPVAPQIPENNEPILIINKIELAIFSNKKEKIAGLESMKLIVIFCHRWDTRAKCWRQFELMTNLPLSECGNKAGPYTFQEVTELYRRRWEIETFFKLIKQHLGYEHLLSLSENGIQIMILMSMITALIMIWYKQQTDIKNGWKAIKFWLADDVRNWVKRSIGAMKICQT